MRLKHLYCVPAIVAQSEKIIVDGVILKSESDYGMGI
jgi:hypothetical protein